MTVKEFIEWLEKQNKPEDAETLCIVKELYERDLKSKKSKEVVKKMEWKKTGYKGIYGCWVGGKRLTLWPEDGKWKLYIAGLCKDVELDKVISAKRPMTYYEAQKAALGFIVICAEEEIKTLQNVIKDCRGD